MPGLVQKPNLNLQASAQSSTFADSHSLPGKVSKVARLSSDGVRGLKAVAMAENTGVVAGGEKPDSMGEYIASRGGSLPIRKVRSVEMSVGINR